MVLKIDMDLLDAVNDYAYGEEADAPFKDAVAEYLENLNDMKLLKILGTTQQIQSSDLDYFEKEKDQNKLLEPFSKLDLVQNIGDIAFIYGIIACWQELKKLNRLKEDK